jgi:hypothetical protein
MTVYVCKNMFKKKKNICPQGGSASSAIKIMLAVLNPHWCCLKYFFSELKSECLFINSHSKILGISRNHFYSHVQVGDMIFQTCLYVFDISQPFPSWIVLGIPSPTCHQDSLLAIPSKRASKVAMPASCLDPGRRAVSLLRHDFPFRPSHVPLKKCCQFWVINDI